jgi:lysophospholipase L1-like esterase
VSILVLGDSTAAGVGAATQDEALPGNLARTLASAWERGATWRAIGENGATSRDIVRRYLAAASDRSYDIVFVTIGANDALGLRSRGAFRRDFRTILRRIRSVSPKALILVSCLPGFAQFDALPNPLRWALGLHADSLESVARSFVRGEPGVLMSAPAPVYEPGFFASDRFHPSSQGYREWVEFALADAKLLSSP